MPDIESDTSRCATKLQECSSTADVLFGYLLAASVGGALSALFVKDGAWLVAIVLFLLGVLGSICYRNHLRQMS